MAILIALGIALAAVAFVAAPFFFGAAQAAQAEMGDEQGSSELQDMLAEKETIYAAIQELDFDFKSGKLSAEDHQSLRQRHEERAATLLQTIDGRQTAARKSEAPRKTRREKRRG
jgi:flagellar basal body-associated protein FliL